MNLRLPLLVRLVGVAEELTPEIKHSFKNQIRDPTGEVISESSGEMAIGATPARPDYLAGITLPAVVAFEPADEGTYTIEFSVDEASVAFPIHVALGPPPGAAAP
jgi:hypothetical protein